MPPQEVKVRSILKGDQEEEKESFGEPMLEKEAKNDDRFISSINGNIVHVTVNNFITADKGGFMEKGNFASTEKKPQQTDTPVKLYNTRPFSSDAK